MKHPSNMGHRFSEVPKVQIPRSTFDRSHTFKLTFDAGYLVPILVDDVLPGDTISCSLNAFARLATPIHPFMDNLWLSTFFFFVPNRLVWTNWEKFNGAQDNPGDSISYTIPQQTAPSVTGYINGTLQDYMGLPTYEINYSHSALPLRCYNLIYNEWFRDQNLQDSVVVDKDDGPDDDLDYVLLKRGKRHDYFTSALPWPQKGDSVEVPIGSTAPVTHITGVGNAGRWRYATTDGLVGADATGVVTDALGESHILATDAYYDPYSTLEADLSSATAATINQLRQSFQIQRLLERDARGGTRYIEIIKSHFGVTSPDARLQRPEYLGGGKTPININPIPQTSSTDGTSPQGNLASFATASVMGHGFNKSFTEHGYIIGIACVHADLTYQQGLERHWSRSTRYDFYWPVLSQIGEQSILNKEIFLDDNVAANESVFGYQERYAEYRYKPSKIAGQFRSNDPNTLDTWHLSQEFGALPVLNASFIVESPPVDRVVAVTTNNPELLMDNWFNYRCARPMPVYGVPGMIDHF